MLKYRPIHIRQGGNRPCTHLPAIKKYGVRLYQQLGMQVILYALYVETYL